MQSDESLYREARQGSNQAFRRLYEKYEGPLFAFVTRRLQNRQEAEDVFHEAMLAIFKGPEADFREGAFAGWLFKVALNLSLNKIRSRQREARALRSIQMQDSYARDGAEDDTEALSHLESSVKDLDGKLKEVYDLRAQGKSYEEMSAIVGVPVGTIRSRVFRMVHHLREEMSRWLAR